MRSMTWGDPLCHEGTPGANRVGPCQKKFHFNLFDPQDPHAPKFLQKIHKRSHDLPFQPFCDIILRNKGLILMKYNKWQQENMAKGLCPLCGKSPTDNRITCQTCRDRINTRQKRRFVEQREQIFAHYGSACECCGEDRTPFLAIDHTENASREGDQRNLTEWVVRNNFPPGFRILCHNCNMATRWGKSCPHKDCEESSEAPVESSPTPKPLTQPFQWVRAKFGHSKPKD